MSSGLNFDRMVQEILRRSKISYDELMLRIRRKQEELSGFVTPEGAAMIVGRELGVEFRPEEREIKELKIEDLVPGMSDIELLARVARVHEPKEFQRPEGMGRVASLILQDETGRIRAALWNEKASMVEKGEIQRGAAVRVQGAYVREGPDQQPELNVGPRAEITIIDPADPRVRELPEVTTTVVRLADLKPGLEEVDVTGRVVALSEPRTFDRPDGTLGRVATLMLMDSTGKARVSLWDGRAEVVRNLRLGDLIKLESASVRQGSQGRAELHVDQRGRVLPAPSAEAEFPPPERRLLKIEDVEAGMPRLDLAARVRRKFKPQEFKRADGTSGRVMSVILEDETGLIRASFWDGGVERAEELRVGSIVLLRNAYTRTGLTGRPEVHVGRGTSIEVNPAGVTVGELKPSAVRIHELEPGMDALEVVGRVVMVGEPREFKRADGSVGKVAALTIGDSTGTARVSLWGEHADAAAKMKVGDVVKLINCYTTAGLFEQVELRLGAQGELELNPAVVEELPPVDALRLAAAPRRAAIEELKDEGMLAEVRGTVVQVLHRRPTFEVCPDCGRSLRAVEAGLLCEDCGKVVAPEHRLLLNLTLDDGTDNIRVVLFGRAAEDLIGMDARRVLELLEQAPDLAELYKRFNLLGREIIVAGITRRNRYSDQLELRGSSVRFADPRQEARALLKDEAAQ